MKSNSLMDASERWFSLVGVALLACYLAARGVIKIEPERLLREGR